VLYIAMSSLVYCSAMDRRTFVTGSLGTTAAFTLGCASVSTDAGTSVPEADQNNGGSGPDTRAKQILDELRKHEAADVIDYAAMASLFAELRTLGDAEIAQAAGVELPPEQPEFDAHALTGRKGELWRNWPHNRESKDISYESPGSLTDLLAFVQAQATARARLKPLGAGFSCSQASQPPNGGVALNTLKNLNKILPLDHVRAKVATSHLVRAEAGIRLEDLAVDLHGRNLALPNLGGFAKQTLAGVMSTATHGTGLRHSSFSDIVVSVDIVCVDADNNATLHRFEPTGGITNPAKYPDAKHRLHQDDDEFYAMVVSCGMLGIVYSYTIQVIDLYFVKETHERFVFPDDFAAAFQRGLAAENISITMHPYSTLPGGKHLGIVTHFERLDKAQVDAIDPTLWANPPTRPGEEEFLGELAKIFGTAFLGEFMGRHPKWTLKHVETWLEKQPSQSFVSVYYKTYPRMTGDRFRGTFSESSVPIADLEKAVSLTFAHANEAVGRYHYLVPFALRFIGASKHLLSMHYGRDSATIEAFFMKGVAHADEALHDLEAKLPMGRPHWGQMHWFVVPVQEHYPTSWEPWLRAYQRHNATGLFNSPITDLLKISKES
jgi:FAD/FMN-containing dehydrogenase